MNLFFLSMLMIASGGVLPLFLWRQVNLAKMIAVIGIGSGCLLGLFDSLFRLITGPPPGVSFSPPGVFPLSFHLDSLSAFFLVSIFTVSLLAAIYSYHYMNNTEKQIGTAVNFLFFSLLVTSMSLVVTAHNMITFMLAWEMMSLSSFFLVIYDYRNPENRKAGYLYFIFSHVGAMFILAAFAVLYGHTGNFDFAGSTIPDTMKILVFVLGFIGFGSKAGVFPFHVWLPHAHPAAPSHISAVMSGVMIKTGIYGILRLYGILDLQTPASGIIVVIFGMVSGIIGVVYALGQHDIKRLLAYHSVENIGIILIGIGIGMIGVSSGNPVMAVLGFSGGILHVFNHSIFKSLLFMGAGMVFHKTGTRSIDALGGLIKSLKITGITFLIGSMAISGLPPFNGFVSEFFIYMGGFKGIARDPLTFVFCLLAIISLAIIGGLALACFTKVVGVVFQGEPRTPNANRVDEKNGSTMIFSMVVLAAACVGIGIFPAPFLVMALKAVSAIGLDYGRIPIEPFAHMTADISLAAIIFLAIMAILAGIRIRLFRGKPIGHSGTWGCGFTRPTSRMQYTGSSYAASILDFFKPVAPMVVDHPPVAGLFPGPTRYASHVHDVIEMHLERIIVNPVLWLFDKLRWIQHGDIHLYIGYILLAIVILLFFV